MQTLRLGGLARPPGVSLRRLACSKGRVWPAQSATLDGVSTAGAASPEEMERREELTLAAGGAAIYGIPRAEWLRLQTPARYLGNEFGAVRKPWGDADVRFALPYPGA